MKVGLSCAILFSGSGSTGEAIVKAWLRGEIPEVDSFVFISTDPEAGGIKRFEALGFKVSVIKCMSREDVPLFNDALEELVHEEGVDFLSFHGNDWQVFPIEGVPMFNSHPANRRQAGGRGRTGIKVHERVLEIIAEDIRTEWAKIEGPHYTEVNYHAVHAEMDQGDENQNVLKAKVLIPNRIIRAYMASEKIKDEEEGEITPARALQKHVMEFERAMLPGAVRQTAMRILDLRQRNAA